MNRPLRAIVAGMLALSALLPAGCFAAHEAADTATSSPQVSPVAPLPPEGAGEYSGYPSGGRAGDRDALSTQDAATKSPSKSSTAGGSGSAAVPSEPMIIRTGSIELRVKDVETSLPAVRAAAKDHGADVAEMSLSAESYGETDVRAQATGPSSASITLRVPADRLDALTDAIAKLGEVITQSETSSDVTEQAVDMEARLKNLRAEEARLRTFLDRADKVDDLLAVQRELSRVRGDIEAMDAQLTYLKRQVARATLVVTLSEPGPVVGPESPWYGIREAFSAGVQGAIEVVKVLITLAIAALPLALLAAFTVWIIVRLVRRSRAKRVAAWATQHDPASEADPSDPEA